jgi:hypothetical protein
VTGLDLITASLKTLQVIGEAETPSAEMAADGLLRLNDLIDSLGTARQTIYATLRTVKTLAASTASYTIGTGGSISIVRPVQIQQANLIIDSTASPVTEIPLRIYSDDEWASIPQKDLTSPLPNAIWYDHGWTAGLARVYVFPVPTVATTQLVLYTGVAVVEFADLATDYTFPPAYRRFLRYNLAREWADELAAEWTPRLERLAMESSADMKRANFRAEEMPGNYPSSPGIYNIYSDTNG